MKLLTWADLTEAQREAAVTHELNAVLRGTCEGYITWGESQPLFDAAFAKADAMQTPWFASEYVMEACGDLLRQVALSQAQNCFYVPPYTEVSTLVLED